MIQFESLNQWLEWLEKSHPNTGIEMGLARISKAAKHLDFLTPKVPVITVAGTNGKGSVVATLESLADAHDLNIGSYTSPHLILFNERIKINGLPLDDETLCQAFSYIANNKGELELTYFEFTTLVGLYCFSQANLDFIALEVGLGGRLDAVNIIEPDVSIITSISLDHTHWLGDTLEKIAYEKAGIARKNKPLVIADKKYVSLFEQAIKEKNPKLIVESDDYQLTIKKKSWCYSTKDFKLEKIQKSSLFITNQAAALTAFLQAFPTRKDQKLLKKALSNAALMGRFSTLSRKPLTILDVAHNPDSAALLNKNIKQLDLPCSAKVWAICGMLKDKDIASSLNKVTQVEHWLCVDLPEPRGAKAEGLVTVLNELDRNAKSKKFSDIESAYDFFSQNASKSDILVVFGSFVTVGQMLEYWQTKCYQE